MRVKFSEEMIAPFKLPVFLNLLNNTNSLTLPLTLSQFRAMTFFHL